METPRIAPAVKRVLQTAYQVPCVTSTFFSGQEFGNVLRGVNNALRSPQSQFVVNMLTVV